MDDSEIDSEILHALALRLTPGVGEVHHGRLTQRFGSARAVLACRDASVLGAEGLRRSTAERLAAGVSLELARRQLERVAELGARVLYRGDPAWPAAVNALASSPPILWVRGTWPPRGPCVSVVGTRSPDGYGLAQAARLSEGCAKAGAWIVSGGALGVDAAAHEGALRVGGGTVVVMGNGLDLAYPMAHARLFDRVVQGGGALLSELPLGTEPSQGTFPRRNRLIAALGEVLVVVQAALRSGALITAREARSLGRPLFAVPGAVDRPPSTGVHRLIRDGALLCENPEDLLERLALAPGPPGPPNALAHRADAEENTPRRKENEAREPRNLLTGDAERLRAALSEDGSTFDELVARVGLTQGLVASLLIELELSGHISVQRGYYRAAP